MIGDHQFSILISVVTTIQILSVSHAGLTFVHVLYRHGDRQPSSTFPKDHNRPHFTKHGWNQLTKKGMIQQHELGQFLRKRYNGFISDEYVPEEIYVRSSDKDRTLQSALCTLAGFYEVKRTNSCDPLLSNFVPVPVHTVPVKDDVLLKMDTGCPIYHEYVKNHTNPAKDQLTTEYLNLFDHLKTHTGLSKVTFQTIGAVYGPLFIGLQQGFPLLPWATLLWDLKNNRTVFDLIVHLQTLKITMKYNSFEKARLTSGYLLGDIVNRMKTITSGKKPDTKPTKMMMYSAHDGTLLSLQYSLNVSNHRIEPYAGCLMIELHQAANDNSSYFVEIYHRNDTRQEPYRLTVPGCPEFSCPFETLEKLLDQSILYPLQKRNRACNVLKKSC